jgi:hypothetical protein
MALHRLTRDVIEDIGHHCDPDTRRVLGLVPRRLGDTAPWAALPWRTPGESGGGAGRLRVERVGFCADSTFVDLYTISHAGDDVTRLVVDVHATLRTARVTFCPGRTRGDWVRELAAVDRAHPEFAWASAGAFL